MVCASLKDRACGAQAPKKCCKIFEIVKFVKISDVWNCQTKMHGKDGKAPKSNL